MWLGLALMAMGMLLLVIHNALGFILFLAGTALVIIFIGWTGECGHESESVRQSRD